MNIKINTHVVLNATFHFFFLLNKSHWFFSLDKIIMNLLQKGFFATAKKNKVANPKLSFL